MRLAGTYPVCIIQATKVVILIIKTVKNTTKIVELFNHEALKSLLLIATFIYYY